MEERIAILDPPSSILDFIGRFLSVHLFAQRFLKRAKFRWPVALTLVKKGRDGK